LEYEGEEDILEYYLRDPKPFQIVVRKKPRLTVYVRRKPVTAYKPTRAQIRARIAFGRAAGRTKGVRYAGRGHGLPPAAEAVKKELKGRSFGGKPRKPEWLKILEIMVKRVLE